MKPITELEILRGMQEDIAGLDLSNPNAVECAIALGHAMERQASRALREMQSKPIECPIIVEIGHDILNADEDAEMDRLERRWNELTSAQQAQARADLSARIQEYESSKGKV